MLHLELPTYIQMEDVEDYSQINDDDWDDMEIENDMENMVDIYSVLHVKKYKTHGITQTKPIGSGSSTFLKMIWVEMYHLGHLLLSFAMMNSHTRTECRAHHSISLIH